MPLSIDDAISLLVNGLRAAPNLSPTYAPNARPSAGCDLRVTDVFRTWWFDENSDKNPMPDPGEMDYAPFYDAGWELARRGIVRPGPAFPAFLGVHPSTEADCFSLTEIGREWIKQYDQQGPFPLDPSRFTRLVDPYGGRFGAAFIQRVTEAAGCYRSLNYLAACAMAGAACESILLAVAIAKIGDETATLRAYSARDGRKTVINQITSGARPFLKQAVETATNLLSYWRDAAAHGSATTISEFEAHDALSRLLRFAQLVDANWDPLTGK